jgi:sugar phosphate permease
MRAWQVALVMTGAPGLLFALLIFTFSEPARRASRAAKASEATGFVGFLRERRGVLLLLTGAFGLVSMLAYAVQAWVPTYLERRFGLAPIQFGPALSIIGVFGSISLFIKGSLMDWVYARGVRDAYMRIYIILLFLSWLPAMIVFSTGSFPTFVACYGVIQIITVSFMGFLVPTVLIGLATDRILHDPQKIGVALRVMASLVVPIAFGLLLLSLKAIRALIAREHVLEPPAARAGA